MLASRSADVGSVGHAARTSAPHIWKDRGKVKKCLRCWLHDREFTAAPMGFVPKCRLHLRDGAGICERVDHARDRSAESDASGPGCRLCCAVPRPGLVSAWLGMGLGTANRGCALCATTGLLRCTAGCLLQPARRTGVLCRPVRVSVGPGRSGWRAMQLPDQWQYAVLGADSLEAAPVSD